MYKYLSTHTHKHSDYLLCVILFNSMFIKSLFMFLMHVCPYSIYSCPCYSNRIFLFIFNLNLNRNRNQTLSHVQQSLNKSIFKSFFLFSMFSDLILFALVGAKGEAVPHHNLFDDIKSNLFCIFYKNKLPLHTDRERSTFTYTPIHIKSLTLFF